MHDYSVVVAGATGVVGRTILQVLAERRFPVGRLRLLATERSAGERIEFGDEKIEVRIAAPEEFRGASIAFFAVGTEASRVMVPWACSAGAVSIDKSNAYRMDPSIPLVVPEVNPDALGSRSPQGMIIASPNCATIQLVVAIKPLIDAAGVERVVVSTYQSVSGSGRGGMSELASQMADLAAGRRPAVSYYPVQIACNIIPHIDSFAPDGYTGEEHKMIAETRKILGLPGLLLSATTVRVPVPVGHAMAVNLQTRKKLTRARALELLKQGPGIAVIDGMEPGAYPTPLYAAGRDEVLVGRIREDPSHEQALDLWVVADNLRKGAATNAVQIAERLDAEGLIGPSRSD